MEDETIIQLFWERSQDAVAELDRKYGRLLHRITGNILDDKRDAEEVVEDTYMKLWSSIPPERPRYLPAYAVKLSRNAAYDLLRRKNRLKRGGNADLCLSELDQCIPSRLDVEAEGEAQAVTELIDLYLATLDRETRAMFVRRYFSMDRLDTLAEDFGLTKNAISTRLTRARRGLREALEKEGVLI